MFYVFSLIFHLIGNYVYLHVCQLRFVHIWTGKSANCLLTPLYNGTIKQRHGQ